MSKLIKIENRVAAIKDGSKKSAESARRIDNAVRQHTPTVFTCPSDGYSLQMYKKM
ncbi:MAG: hypothetical protein LBF89_11175 [Bacteroidales bacterium]|jgi:hypothetical protein|nr:hypothetical protein [Bacteroidales bacterium]